MPAPALSNLQRELLAHHFAEKATAAFGRLADDRGLSADDLSRLAHGHERARTDRPASAGDGA